MSFNISKMLPKAFPALSNIGSSLLKQVSPKTLDALKSVVGDAISKALTSAFDGLKKQGASGASQANIPSPLTALAKFAPPGFDIQSLLSGGGLDKILKEFAANRPVPGAPAAATVSPPAVGSADRTSDVKMSGKFVQGMQIPLKPDMKNFDLTKNEDMAVFQQQMQTYKEMMDAINNICKNHSSIRDSLIQNFK